MWSAALDVYVCPVELMKEPVCVVCCVRRACVCPVELMKEPVCVVCCVRRVCVSCRVDEGASVCGLLC